jgi:hypothetical protein
MIPKLQERAYVENSDAVDTWGDQFGSDVETPTTSATSATSTSCTYDIPPHIFQFTRDCGIEIPLPVANTPVWWLNFFMIT